MTRRSSLAISSDILQSGLLQSIDSSVSPFRYCRLSSFPSAVACTRTDLPGSSFCSEGVRLPSRRIRSAVLSRTCRRASRAGLAEVPVLVREVPNEAAAAMALIENIQREDLNPLEEAQGLQRLIREFGLTHEQAAQAVGRSRSAASNLLRLLNLAEPVQQMLMAGDIDMGHARALLTLDRAAQITAGHQIVARHLSVRDTERLVKKLGAEFQLVSAKPKKEKSRDVRRIEEELSDALTAQVEVRLKKRIKRHGQWHEVGEVAIQFGSLEELNGLIDHLRKP